MKCTDRSRTTGFQPVGPRNTLRTVWSFSIRLNPALRRDNSEPEPVPPDSASNSTASMIVGENVRAERMKGHRTYRVRRRLAPASATRFDINPRGATGNNAGCMAPSRRRTTSRQGERRPRHHRRGRRAEQFLKLPRAAVRTGGLLSPPHQNLDIGRTIRAAVFKQRHRNLSRHRGIFGAATLSRRAPQSSPCRHVSERGFSSNAHSSRPTRESACTPESPRDPDHTRHFVAVFTLAIHSITNSANTSNGTAP